MLLDPASVARLANSVRELVDREFGGERPLLLVMDTFAHAVAGAQENDNGAMGAAARALLDLARDLGCAVLLVHHAKRGRKPGESYLRGASSLLCALDVSLGIGRVRGEELVRLVETEKQKDRPDGSSWRVSLAPVELDKNRTTLRVAGVEPVSPPTSEVARGTARDAQRLRRWNEALAALLAVGGGGASQTATREELIHRGVDVSPSTLRRLLDGLRAAHLVDRRGCS